MAELCSVIVLPGTERVWTPALLGHAALLLTIMEVFIYSTFPECQPAPHRSRAGRRPARSGETSRHYNIYNHQCQPGGPHLFSACYS